MDSILDSIKKLLGIDILDTSFDGDLIIYINSVFAILNQLGVGPSEVFWISDNGAIWDEFIYDYAFDLQLLKSYIYLKVKLIFDPPASSFVLESNNRLISEFEWRLNVHAEHALNPPVDPVILEE